MPKKRAPKYDTKPSSPAHPSLSSTKPKDASHSLTSSQTPDGNSVNDRLRKLRLSEQHASSSAESRRSSELFNPSSNISLPPSLRNILQIPDAPPPRPRPGLRVSRALRLPAGPAAPQSWLRATRSRAGEKRQNSPAIKGAAISFESLPGAYLPHHDSLLASMLKALAKNWDWHRVYDQYYLATIPVRYKEALLHYIVEAYEYGIDKDSLELLFQDESELEDATGTEGLTHLDLATSIGYPLKLSDLKALLSFKQPTSLPENASDITPESWEDTEGPKHGLSPTGRFDSLTHLSLAHPAKSATWKGLLDLAPHLLTITHLSLAYWPTPTLSLNSKTAYRETPQGNVNYGASDFYSELDQDRSEAASLLRRLSKSTYCLQWLDLTGCHPWVLALSDLDLDFCGAWRALETVRVGQGPLPGCFQADADEGAWRHELRSRSREFMAWATAEQDTIELEKVVNIKIGLAIRRSQPGVRDNDTDASELTVRPESRGQATTCWQEGDLAFPDRPSGQEGVRRGRVMFERGWDAWWIKKAIDQLATPMSVRF